jgi:hypothetical protein
MMPLSGHLEFIADRGLRIADCHLSRALAEAIRDPQSAIRNKGSRLNKTTSESNQTFVRARNRGRSFHGGFPLFALHIGGGIWDNIPFPESACLHGRFKRRRRLV